MAFGVSPRNIQEQIFDGLTYEELLITAFETANKLNWKIGFTSQRAFIAYSKFSMSSWGEAIHVNVEHQKLIVKSECTGNQIIDWGKNKQNVDAFFNAFKETMGKLSPDDIAHRYQQLGTDVTAPSHLIKAPSKKLAGLGGHFFSFFIPAKTYFITPIIINLNILVFVVMILSGVDVMLPDTESLIVWGANFRPATLGGEWWRLLSSCFLHIGVIHLLMNVYALMYIGMQLEPMLGKRRFLLAYLLSGVAGSVNSLYWHELTVSAGASGAIFGMYGVFLAMLTTNLIERAARQTMLTSIAIFVGYNLLNGVRGGIDNAAHIGGLIAGLVIGYSFYPSLLKPNEEKLRYLTMTMVSLAVLTYAFVIYQRTPNDIGTYEQKMNEFVTIESLALGFYNKDLSAPKEELLKEIKDHGIHYWKEGMRIIAEADKLSLPEVLHAKNKKLIKYCDLRIKCYQLIYKAVAENTENYKIEIENYDKQIEDIVKELSIQ
ncbi:MAG TPA: rhomboid family intramembrane serine protease [Chryseolinea sp.]